MGIAEPKNIEGDALRTFEGKPALTTRPSADWCLLYRAVLLFLDSAAVRRLKVPALKMVYLVLLVAMYRLQ